MWTKPLPARRYLAMLASVAALGCTGGRTVSAPLSGADSARIIAGVEAATWAFHAADTARSAEGVISLLWPQYSMLVDGGRVTYEQVAAGSREFMGTLVLFHTEWTELRVVPLGRDAAVSSFLFRDSIVTRAGDVIRQQGSTTLVWQRRGDVWRVIHGDADHRPITP